MYKTIATPQILENLSNPPKRLYIKGDIKELDRAVAIVGSRRPTREGAQIAHRLAYELSLYGITIISGLARGIDAAAHHGAVEAGGYTIAVLPCGIKEVYPKSNWGLARQIIDSGGTFISEYGDNRMPRREDFLARNRIIAGLSVVTVVVEAARRSGALNTAAHALEASKEVMAVPGSINNPMAVGTNRLIQQGATPVTDTKDILNVMGLEVAQEEEPTIVAYTPEEKHIVDLIGRQIIDFDELINKVGGRTSETQALITEMEIKGVLKRLPGNFLQIVV